jgi:ABC-type Na+ efflux pump permease subunit
MTFLPVVERELRVAARRRATHVIRLVAASVGFGVTIWILIAARDAQPQEISGVLFSVMVVLVFLFAFLVAPQITADCISEEKRDGTLGLLFLTDLKGYDIVFGKLVATSVHAFYGMLALAPIMAIPLLMGGISRDEVLRAVLISLNLLCFSLNAGMLASAICRRDARAHSLAFGIAWLPLLCPFAVHLTHHAHPKASLVDLFSPVDGCFLAFDPYYKLLGSVHYFWLNAAMTQIYSWIYLGLACWITPRSWQDQPFKKEKSYAREQQHPTARSRRRTPLLDLNPFQWRASRARFRQGAVWLFLAFLAALWKWVTWATGARNDAGILIPIDLLFLATAGLMMKAWIGAESGRALGEDRRNGALELLLSTRLTPREIINGQLRAVWRQFAPPVCALLVINLVALVVEFAKMRHTQAFRTWHPDDRALTIGSHVIVGLFLVLDSVALIWVGMWRGFIARKPNRAVMPAMLQIVALPGILFLLCISLSGGEFSGGGAMLLWGVLGLAADLIFWALAFTKLMDNFRSFVSEGRVPKRTPPVIP